MQVLSETFITILGDRKCRLIFLKNGRKRNVRHPILAYEFSPVDPFDHRFVLCQRVPLLHHVRKFHREFFVEISSTHSQLCKPNSWTHSPVGQLARNEWVFSLRSGCQALGTHLSVAEPLCLFSKSAPATVLEYHFCTPRPATRQISLFPNDADTDPNCACTTWRHCPHSVFVASSLCPRNSFLFFAQNAISSNTVTDNSQLTLNSVMYKDDQKNIKTCWKNNTHTEREEEEGKKIFHNNFASQKKCFSFPLHYNSHLEHCNYSPIILITHSDKWNVYWYLDNIFPPIKLNTEIDTMYVLLNTSTNNTPIWILWQLTTASSE